jgi:hypothetical protein
MTYKEAAKFEHSFWLQILGDHARFILDSLAEKEKADIQQAKYFKQKFDQYLSQARSNMDMHTLTLAVKKDVQNMRFFKLKLIEKLLLGKITIHLSPTFINHMVNEIEEYILVLNSLEKKEIPPVQHELHYHLAWLPDAAGHAAGISSNLDQVEKRLKEKSEMYTLHFDQFYLKALELTGYLRTNLQSFPALERMNKDVKLEIELFSKFLHELEELELSEQALGTFSALMADHMAREECYYLTKLSQSAQLPPSQCDPTKPRTERSV